MAIEDRNLAVGTKLVARYGGHECGCVVTTREGDKVGYRMECPDLRGQAAGTPGGGCADAHS